MFKSNGKQKVKYKVEEVPQSQAAAKPRHKEEFIYLTQVALKMNKGFGKEYIVLGPNLSKTR